MSRTVAQIVQIWAFDESLVKTTPFQLLQWKHALALEAEGLTLSRGKKVSTHLRKLLKTPRGYPVEHIRAHIEESIKSINEQLGVGQ
jgi:hypothetical protein